MWLKFVPRTLIVHAALQLRAACGSARYDPHPIRASSVSWLFGGTCRQWREHADTPHLPHPGVAPLQRRLWQPHCSDAGAGVLWQLTEEDDSADDNAHEMMMMRLHMRVLLMAR